jgi:hypothetical protein
VLSAETGTWNQAPTSVDYQWLRNGSAITGATEATYRLRAADAGRRVAVRVSAHKDGFTDGAATSRVVRVAKLPVSLSVDLVKHRVARGERGRLVVGVVAPGRVPEGGALKVRSHGRTLVRVLHDGSGLERIRLPRLAPGRHRLVIVHGGSDQLLREVSAPTVLRVTRHR